MWRLHATVLVVALVSEWIGVRRVSLGPGVLLFLPLLYAFVAGALLNPNVVRRAPALLGERARGEAKTFIVVAILPFVARFGAEIGPAIEDIVAAGPALALQELGNLATLALALPIAVLVFGMGREAVGATYSIAREPNIAIISARYGLSSPEGTGVLAVYAMGTLFGTLVFAMLASLAASTDWLHPESLAMACGVGSGSMMAACAGALAEAVPSREDAVFAFAGASNLLTYATGLYAGLFIALPVAERMYGWLADGTNPSAPGGPGPLDAGRSPAPVVSAGALAVTVGLVWGANLVGQRAHPGASALGAAMLFAITGAGLLGERYLAPRLPGVAWVSLAGILVTLPFVPGAATVARTVGTIDVLSTATPCLAYAGLAIGAKDVETLRASGGRLVAIALLVFVSTYVGSAVVAELVLRATGRI